MVAPGVDSIIPFLKGHEIYPFWKFQVLNFIQAKGVLGNLLRTVPKSDRVNEMNGEGRTC